MLRHARSLPTSARERFQLAARLCGVASSAVGAVVFALGWVHHSEAVITAGQHVAMAPTSAGLFMLTGCALCLLASRRLTFLRRALGAVLAAGAVVLSGLVMIEYGTTRTVGIETVLGWFSSGHDEIPRVSFHAAASFLLLGLALLLVDQRRAAVLSDVLCLTVLLNAVIASSSYVFGESPFIALPEPIPVSGMALHTSLTMLLLSFGVLAARPGRGVMAIVTSEHAGGQMVRPLLAAAAVIPFLGTLILAGERTGQYGTELRTPIAITLAVFVTAASVILVARRVNRLEGRRRAAERRALQMEQLVASRQRFLAELGDRLSTSLDLQVTLQNVVESAVPYLADWAVVDLAGSSGHMRRAAIVHADPTRAALTQELLRRAPSTVRDVVQAAVAQGRTVVRTDVTEDWLRAAAPDRRVGELLATLGVRSYVIVPLRARERTVGALSFVKASRNFTEEETHLAEEVGRRAALFADNSRLYEDARDAIRTREELMAMVSHDLRNPLNAIRLGLQLIAKRLPPAAPGKADPRKPLAEVERASVRALKLIDDLLDVARLEAGTLPMELRDEQVEDLLQELMWVMAPIAAERGVALQAQRAPGLWARCDRPRILQVLENLVGNAIKFSPAGAPVRVAATPRDHQVLFTVSDQGPGIAREDQEYVFDRFWQAAHSKRQGAGLGLSIAQGIVLAHGGEIGVQSEPGRGSTFYFTLLARGAEEGLLPPQR